MNPRRRIAGMFARGSGAAIDRGLLALMTTEDRLPGDDDYGRIADEVEATLDHFRNAGVLERPAGFHPEPPPLLDPEVGPVWLPGLSYERIAFDSGHDPDVPEPARSRWLAHARNRIAYAWMLRHDDATRPWLVCLHGLGAGNPVMEFAGFRARYLYRELGLNLIFPVLPLHGPRRGDGMLRGALVSYELVDTICGMAQAVWDVRRLMGWIRDRGGTRFGVYGLSMGAYTAALLSAFEPLEMMVAGIPVADIPRLFVTHSTLDFRELGQRHGILGEGIEEIFRVVSPLELSTLVPFERRYVFAGLADRISTPAQARILWEAWDQPTVTWFHGGHVSAFWSGRVEGFVGRALAESGFAEARGPGPENGESTPAGPGDGPRGEHDPAETTGGSAR